MFISGSGNVGQDFKYCQKLELHPGHCLHQGSSKLESAYCKFPRVLYVTMDNFGTDAICRVLYFHEFSNFSEILLALQELTAANILPKISSFSCDEIGSKAQLAVVILAEQKLGKDSEWAPYISCLPQSGELHSTIFWTKDELEMIQNSFVYQETINHKDRLEKEYLKVKPVSVSAVDVPCMHIPGKYLISVIGILVNESIKSERSHDFLVSSPQESLISHSVF
ncbi:hypothetical protein ACLOJK_001622 [Asimina triloba]